MQTLIELKNVHKSYSLGHTKVAALNDVTLEIFAGEFTAVIGASGSGKSTLLNLIGCIDDPDSGSISLEGLDLVSLSDNQKSDLRNKNIGFIFQSFNLIPVLNIYENVELPLLINSKFSTKMRREKIKQAIDDVGLTPFQLHLPDQLSGGQRQRVAIARALAGEPKLVLADEPTANLDSVTSGKIIDLMIDLNSKRHVTFLFSTHDERLMNKVSRTVHLRDGKIQHVENNNQAPEIK